MLLTSVTESLESALIIAHDTDGFDKDKMIKSATKNRANFQVMAKLADMLKELSRVYNYRNTKNVLYFEDCLRKNGSDHRDYSENTARGFFTTGKRESESDVSTLKKRDKS